MRTYGRVYDEFGDAFWVVVQTDSNGNNDAVYLTALAQCLKLNLGESPFWANLGIPAHTSIIQQIAPDFYIQQIQRFFAPFFVSLIITKNPPTPSNPTPTYTANVLTHSGAKLAVGPIVVTDGFGRPVVDGYGHPVVSGQTQQNVVPI